MDCYTEIIGIKELTLYLNSGIRLVFPDISNESQVNLITDGSDSYSISESISNIKWSRKVDYSGNYKQNYFDEFMFQISGIENQTPEIIKEFRNNRLGYIATITTTGNQKYIFQAPVFLNKENTKQVDSHTWDVSFSYKIPSFLDKLTLLSSVLVNNPVEITNNIEIVGVQYLGIYINSDVVINRPDPANENEVDIIIHGQGSYVISDPNELPKWERITNNSGNFTQSFIDKFSFILHGIENNVPLIIEELRNNRLGYIIEIITTGGKSFIFPTPVFLDSENTKPIDSHSWQISLSYRVPTLKDKLTKLNTLLMDNSYILVGDNEVLGFGEGAIVIN